MHKDWENLFNCLETPEPADGLFDKILQRIRKEQRLSIFRRQLALFSIGVVGSSVALIPAFQMVQSELVASGFVEFFSLLFSDLGLVMAHWQNFVFALLESLPVMSIVAFLAVIFIFIESLKFLTHNINTHTKRGWAPLAHR